jgi:hypothetical protein
MRSVTTLECDLDLPGHSLGYRGRPITVNGRAGIPNEPTVEESLEFDRLRTQEVIAGARRALGDRASSLTDEVVLGIYRAELRQNEFTTSATN